MNVDDLEFVPKSPESYRQVGLHKIPTKLVQLDVSVIETGKHYAIHPETKGWASHIVLQSGDISEAGVNGLTISSLLAVLVDTMEARCLELTDMELELFDHLRHSLAVSRDVDIFLAG